jgi:hypothetical protein
MTARTLSAWIDELRLNARRRPDRLQEGRDSAPRLNHTNSDPPKISADRTPNSQSMAGTQQPKKRAKRRSPSRSTRDTAILVARYALWGALALSISNVVAAWLSHH